MKLSHLLQEEDAAAEREAFIRWQQACRSAFPNCTFAGATYNSQRPPLDCQAVDWVSDNNEVAGDWNNGTGVVYEPGSLGKQIRDKISTTE